MELTLTGHNALVTGANGGLGSHFAETLAKAGASVAVAARRLDSLRLVQSSLTKLGARFAPVALDVTDPEGVRALAERVGGLGRLRAVAHAAGISPTMADWRAILSVDLIGTALLLDALHPLVGEGTAAVCFASMAAVLLVPNGDAAVDPILDDPLAPGFLDRLREAIGAGLEDTGTAYSWAKRGVQRLVRREAVRWGAAGGRVSSISPGMIDTPQGRQEAAAQPLMKVLLDHTPLRREGRPEEIAAVVAFLLSDEASFLTGTDVLVDGGVVAALSGTAPADL
jgi:NAD(P)-dependent dehydrogenase (short-subunit alcohol dehydrogenase family)